MQSLDGIPAESMCSKAHGRCGNLRLYPSLWDLSSSWQWWSCNLRKAQINVGCRIQNTAEDIPPSPFINLAKHFCIRNWIFADPETGKTLSSWKFMVLDPDVPLVSWITSGKSLRFPLCLSFPLCNTGQNTKFLCQAASDPVLGQGGMALHWRQ